MLMRVSCRTVARVGLSCVNKCDGVSLAWQPGKTIDVGVGAVNPLNWRDISVCDSDMLQPSVKMLALHVSVTVAYSI